MLIPMSFLSRNYGVNPASVAHIGGHLAEEYDDYMDNGVKLVYWFEANPQQVKILRKKFENLDSQFVISGAAWDSDNQVLKFKIASNSLSSSLYNLGTHIEKYPDIFKIEEIDVSTLRLDTYFSDKQVPEMLNLDIQGAELGALKGASSILAKVKYIYTEVSFEAIYEKAPLADELNEYLESMGFKKVLSRRLRSDGWGDVFYINRNLVKLPTAKYFSRKFGSFIFILSNYVYALRLCLHKMRKSVKNA